MASSLLHTFCLLLLIFSALSINLHLSTTSHHSNHLTKNDQVHRATSFELAVKAVNNLANDTTLPQASVA